MLDLGLHRQDSGAKLIILIIDGVEFALELVKLPFRRVHIKEYLIGLTNIFVGSIEGSFFFLQRCCNC